MSREAPECRFDASRINRDYNSAVNIVKYEHHGHGPPCNERKGPATDLYSTWGESASTDSSSKYAFNNIDSFTAIKKWWWKRKVGSSTSTRDSSANDSMNE
jgi:hypothetical protein